MTSGGREVDVGGAVQCSLAGVGLAQARPNNCNPTGSTWMVVGCFCYVKAIYLNFSSPYLHLSEDILLALNGK